MVDRLLRYLAGTRDFGILYRYGNEEPLCAFADANWAHETERRSRSGYLYLWGGAPVVWSSRKQTHATPLHTAESEWYAMAECVKEGLWLRNLFGELMWTLPTPIVVYEDNEACVKMVKSEQLRGLRHVELRWHFVLGHIREHRFVLSLVRSNDNVADIFTKPLAAAEFTRQAARIMVRNHS